MKAKQAAARLKHWRFGDPLYDVQIVLLHGPWKSALSWMNKTFSGVSESEVGTGTGAKTIWMEREVGSLVLWFPAWFDTTSAYYLSVLAHESFHAAEFVLRARGFTLSDATDEAYAYYIAWMFRECHMRLSR